MTSPEEHKKNIKQFLEDINEKIRAGLLLERQKIIGFASSEAAANLLEYYLHKKNVVSSGFQVNHNFFSSTQRAQHFLDFEFSHKEELISLMIKQEEFRDFLCYGKEKRIEKIEEAISNVNRIKKIILTELGEEQ